MRSSDGVKAILSEKPREILVFDADEFLVTWIEEKRYGSAEFLEWFKEKKLTERLCFTIDEQDFSLLHIFLPGVPEFFRYVSQLPIEFCLFSAGHEERNKTLVDALYKRAFNDDFRQKFTFLDRNIQVFSRDHMETVGKESKKNLTTVLKFIPGDLASTILIDNTKENILDSQIKNGLITYTASPSIFNNANSYHEYSDEQYSGRSRHLFSANQIFYVTGLLKRIFLLEGSLAENLFHLQYRKVGDDYEFNDQLYSDRSLYLEGFRELQKFNVEGNLSFFGKDAKEFFEEKPSLCDRLSSTGQIALSIFSSSTDKRKRKLSATAEDSIDESKATSKVSACTNLTGFICKKTKSVLNTLSVLVPARKASAPQQRAIVRWKPKSSPK